MNKLLLTNKTIYGYSFLVCLFLSLIILLNLPFLPKNSNVDLGITVDLLLTIPLAYYFFIKGTPIPKTSVFGIMTLGYFVGKFFISESRHTYLDMFQAWVFPLIKIISFIYLIYKLRRAYLKSVIGNNKLLDSQSRLDLFLKEILPNKLINVLKAEIRVLDYVFCKWQKVFYSETEFTYHNKSTSISTLGAFCLSIGIETFVLHTFLIKWNTTIAWIVTSLSMYTIVQVLGITKSLSRKPYIVNDNYMELNYGIFRKTKIKLSEIEEVSQISNEIDDKQVCFLSPLRKIDSYNIIIKLKSKGDLENLYGFSKQYSQIAFYVDQPKKLISQLKTTKLN